MLVLYLAQLQIVLSKNISSKVRMIRGAKIHSEHEEDEKKLYEGDLTQTEAVLSVRMIRGAKIHSDHEEDEKKLY